MTKKWPRQIHASKTSKKKKRAASGENMLQIRRRPDVRDDGGGVDPLPSHCCTETCTKILEADAHTKKVRNYQHRQEQQQMGSNGQQEQYCARSENNMDANMWKAS